MEYKVIAVREDGFGQSIVSFCPEKKRFKVAVNGKVLEDLTMTDLKSLTANIDDVISQKGRYLYIEGYDEDE